MYDGSLAAPVDPISVTFTLTGWLATDVSRSLTPEVQPERKSVPTETDTINNRIVFMIFGFFIMFLLWLL
jgi:hypothetical protein